MSKFLRKTYKITLSVRVLCKGKFLLELQGTGRVRENLRNNCRQKRGGVW